MTIIKKLLISSIPSRFLHKYRLKHKPLYRKYFEQKQEVERLKKLPRFQESTTTLFDKKVYFADKSSYHFLKKEIFNQEIYKFNHTSKYPRIIDVGSNIGLSILYFKQLYPDAEVIGFEPDPRIFNILRKNIESFNCTKTKIFNKGIWIKETTLEFFSEGADGGRIATAEDTNKISISTTSLRGFLTEKVDMLKIDIEGAEYEVLNDCKDLLHNVDNLFVEYHSFKNQNQNLHKLLEIINSAEFRYNIHHIGVYSPQPFIKVKNYLNMDLQLNIFAYRNGQS